MFDTHAAAATLTPENPVADRVEESGDCSGSALVRGRLDGKTGEIVCARGT